jgi:hypothetical protein
MPLLRTRGRRKEGSLRRDDCASSSRPARPWWQKHSTGEDYALAAAAVAKAVWQTPLGEWPLVAAKG